MKTLNYLFIYLFLMSSFIFAESRAESNNSVPFLKFITEAHQSKGGDTTYGPIKIRQKFEDWNKDLLDVKGASISYSNDRIENTGTWLTKGSIIYPIESDRAYSALTLLPSIQWKRETAEIDELTFQLPVSYFIAHEMPKYMEWSSDFYFSPYYLTDFDFDGKMIGAELTYEPTIQIGRRFQTGSWHSLFGGMDIAYLLRIIPGLTYGHILSEGPYINRDEKDDTLAITCKLEFGLMPFGDKTPWEIRGNYNFLYDFSGESDGYVDLWSASTIWWFNKNVGLDLSYQKGDTPLTKKEVDLVKLNLQFRL